MSERDPGAHEAADAETRAQIRALLDQTLLVEAGAGTGKTSALVDRVVALVLGGRPIDRIAAITFTEKAAAELRDRVRGALEVYETVDPRQLRLIQDALVALDRAQISTIHSFGQALLRAFAAEAGIDPAFAVEDEVMAERRFEERWRQYLDGLASEPDAVEAVNAALDLGLTTRDIGVLARELWSRSEVASMLRDQPLTVAAPAWPDLEEARQRLAALHVERVDVADGLRKKVEQVAALVERLLWTGDDRVSFLAASAATLALKLGSGGRASAWGGPAAKEQARVTAEDIRDRLADLLAGLRTEALAALLPFIARFVLEDGPERGREGKLVFDDLILRARDLLRDSPDVRRAVRERYDTLLIDEFQDTDPTQVEIAWSFATRPETGKLEPGRLFLVGDPKQSIYRFRRADMEVYSQARDRVAAEAKVLQPLSLTGRCRPAIVAWVNAVLANLIGEGEEPSVQPRYSPIVSRRTDDLGPPGVAWIGQGMVGPAREVRRAEAAAVAAHCRGAIEAGWMVAERDGAARPASFRDVAILVPTRAILQPLERALAAAGIPYRVEGGSLVYGTQEVRDLLNCLTAIDDPADEVAIVGALRSPAYACSDVEIAQHRAGGFRLSYLSPGATPEGRVTAALASLGRFHDRRHEQSLAALVEDVVTDRGLAEVSIYDDGSRNSFRRARFVIEQARAFEAAGPESLRAFVTWLERRAGQTILDHEGAGLDDDEDAVRVLTIHGAKGLEFPIVFVAGLGASPSNRADVLGVDRANRQVAVSIGAKWRNARFELGPVDHVQALERQHALAERDRLLYVAATRARDHLVLSLFHSRQARKTAAQRLIEAGAKEQARPLPPVALAPPRPASSFAGLRVDAPPSPEAFEAERTALVTSAAKRRYTSATALARLARQWEGEAAEKEERADESEPWARGRARTHLGRAVHAALQSLAWEANDATVAAVARAQAVAEAIPDLAPEVARLARKALESDAAARARQASRALREVPFAAAFGGTVLEGFIDLVIEDGDGLEVVDWKTDDIAPLAVDRRLKEYELQAGLYVLGLEAATRRSVRRVTYVFVSAGVERSPGDPAALAAAAHQALDSGAIGG